MLKDNPGRLDQHPIVDGLLANGTFFVVLTDQFGKITAAGAGVESILGYAPEELEGKIFHALLIDPKEIRQRAQTENGQEAGFSVLASGKEQIWTLLGKNERRVPVLLNANGFENPADQDGYLFLGRSANEVMILKQQVSEMQTKLTVAQAKLAALSVTDELTGLKNRQAFKENLEREFRRAIRHHGPLSVILVAIDDFKSYNDDFGGAAGDQALKTLAEGLLRTTRSTDYLARYESVVFGYILPETDADGALIKANRIEEQVRAMCFANRQLSVSIGVATMGTDSPVVQGITNSAQLMDRAKKALSASKTDTDRVLLHYNEIL